MRRVLVLSHTYLQPAHRGKLRALAARGLEVTVAIPQRWREPWFGRPIDVAWERQGGLEVFPLPARDLTRYSGRALRSEEHTSELQSRFDLVCRLLLEKKKRRRPTPGQWPARDSRR